MKKRLFSTVLVLMVFVLVATYFRSASVQAQQGLGGPIARDMWVPSALRFFFGDVTTSDIYLQKNGANVLGVSGLIGGSGATANTTTSPAGPYAWGTVALSSNTATVTFSKAFTNVPTCVATEFTGVFAVKIAPTATTAVITNTGGGATDTINWMCFGNPN